VEIARARFSAGGARPEVSGALVLAARALAREYARGADPTRRATLRDALAAGHAFDPAPMPYAALGPPERWAEALARALGPGMGSATHVGAGAAQADGGIAVVVLASNRGARLDPFPQRVATGARETLSGQLRAGLCDARVFVTRPSGGVEEIASPRGVWFRVSVAFEEPGRHAVEVLAQGPLGPTVAALFPVAAGDATLEEPPGPAPAADPPDTARTEAAVVAALQALRARQGLPSLTADPALAAVARRHSEAMRRAASVSHTVPGSAGPEERLRSAGIGYQRAFENVAASSTAVEAHEAAAASPAHRRNMLEPGIRRVGVGVSREILPSGKARVYLTEIFVE
jgi:uncharacterized protein YkwD